MRISPRPLLLALSAGTLLFTACASGSDDEASDAPVADSVSEDGAADGDAAASFNDADVMFVQGMIPHHRDAIEMAAMALEPDAQASAEVQALATQIQGAQDPEIEQMTNMLDAWGQPMDMSEMDGHDMDGMGDDEMDEMAGMEGMMSEEDMATLATLSGPEFDAAWLSAMIAHHEGAVSMSQTVKASGANAEVVTLADAIIAGQQAEIEEMRALTGS